MNNGNSWVLQDALKFINKHFRFMLDQGYEVYSAKDYPDAGWPVWEVVLRKQDLFVRVYAERGAIEELSFRTNTQPPNELTDIGSVVYGLTGEKFVPNFFFWNKGYANLLQKHLNKIESYFGSDYIQNKDSLKFAQKEYHEATSPKEAKIIPLLYYPLMGIIIIILVGFLTTVYMVLLDILFSALSIDDDRYRTAMAVVSLLLAIGTILAVRRRSK